MHEPPVISDCTDSEGRTNHTLIEANGEVQQICNMAVTFDDQQESFECNVTEMSSPTSLFEAARINVKEQHHSDGFLRAREEGRARVPIKIAGRWAQ